MEAEAAAETTDEALRRVEARLVLLLVSSPGTGCTAVGSGLAVSCGVGDGGWSSKAYWFLIVVFKVWEMTLRGCSGRDERNELAQTLRSEAVRKCICPNTTSL